MSYLDTIHLAEDYQFLKWLFHHDDFKIEKAEELTDVYLSSQMGIEFFLVMCAYYCQQFPDKVGVVYELARHVDLLNETSSYIDCEHVKMYLEYLYGDLLG